MMAQRDESQYTDEIEALVVCGRTNCLPSIAVSEANNCRPGAEMVISGNSKNEVSGINVSAHPLQNENATSQPSSTVTVSKNGLNNSIGENMSIEPGSMHMPSQMAGSGPNYFQPLQPSSAHMSLYTAPPEGSENQSIQPSSIHGPSGSSGLQNSIGQNNSVQPSSINMLSYTAPPVGTGLHSSIGQNQSVQPSSIHGPPGSSGFQNSIGQNYSVQPHMYKAPAKGDNQQQIGQNQVPATHRQLEAGRSQMQSHQKSREINKEDNPSSSQQSRSQGSADLIRTDLNCTSLQQSDNQGKKKVFILHSIPENSRHSDALHLFATTLRDLGINVSIDLFELDISHDNWSMWYEREILSSKVVLCIITPDFYKSITEHDRIKGYAIYNLMGDSTKDIAFRAVFLDTQKNMEDIPLSMRGATIYCISSNDLSVPDNDEFTNLYAFLTGQNRVEKPKLGKVIKLAPKKSRFGQARSQHAPINRDHHMYQQRSPINAPQPSPPVSNHRNEQAKLLFDLLSKDTTQVKSLRSHQRMFATLATSMTAKWEMLARMLEIGDNNVFAIKSDHRDSVQEQAVQMFQKWLETNGSAATLGVLTRAVYESGPQYYNLLDIVNKFAPK